MDAPDPPCWEVPKADIKETREGFVFFAGSPELASRYSAGCTTTANVQIFVMPRYITDLQQCCAIGTQEKSLFADFYFFSSMLDFAVLQSEVPSVHPQSFPVSEEYITLWSCRLWTGTLPRVIPAVPGPLQRREGAAIKVGGIWGGRVCYWERELLPFFLKRY